MAMATTVYVARHGERIDHIDELWKLTAENPADPFLTETGIRQASALGSKLASKGLTHIFCSPFYRTIQTANEVSKATGVDIKIEAGLSEFLNPEWFPTNPRLMLLQELKKEFPSIDTTYVSQKTPSFPETREALIARAGETARTLASKFSGNILLVAHGITCEFTVRGITGTGPIPYISYCSLQTCGRKDNADGQYYIEGSEEPDISFMPEQIRPVVRTDYR